MGDMLRVWGGLVLFFVGLMQARLTWRGLYGLSLTRDRRGAGCLLALLMMGGGLVLAAVPPLQRVILCAPPALVTAMIVLLVLASWINPHMKPLDLRCPGPDDPWTCEPFSFADGDVQTPALLLRPTQPTGAAVCWVHGSGDEKAQWKWSLARALTGRGITLLAFDLPGHGAHPRQFALPDALTVVPAALSYLGSQPQIDANRIGLMGVSLGGALSIRALADAPSGSIRLPQALCLLETPCSLWVDWRTYVREALAMATLQGLAVFQESSPANLLRAYLARIRARFVEPVSWVFDDLAPSATIGHLPQLPLLIVNGQRDPIAPPDYGKRLFQRARPPRARHVVYGGSHLNLIFIPETVQLVVSWFDQHLNGTGAASNSSGSDARDERLRTG